MNLCIDIGNTQLKWGVFQQDLLMDKGVCAPKMLGEQAIAQHSFSSIIYCSVASDETNEVIQKCFNHPIIEFTIDFALPFGDVIQPYHGMGVDRWAGLWGAWGLIKRKGYVVVDAGTCITLDVVDAKKGYVGGGISPGIQMRYAAMHAFTAKLPKLENTFSLNDALGNSTDSAMQFGVQNGVIAEIQTQLHHLTKLHNFDTVFFTGGDASFIAKHVQLQTQTIIIDTDLVLKGLHFALLQT